MEKQNIKKWILTLNEPSGKLNLIHLTIPLLLQQLLSYSLSSVHTIAMTKVSPEAVAAISVSSTILTLANQIANCPALGFSILFNHALGRGDYEEGNRLFSSGIASSLFMTFLLSLGLYLFAPQLMQLYRLEPKTLEYAILYLRIQALFMFINTFSMFFTAAINCFGKTISIMLISFLRGILNVALCLLIVNNIIPFSNKLVGVALSGVLSNFIGTAMFLLPLLSVRKIRFTLKFSITQVKSICSLGISSQMSVLAWQVAGTITTGMVASLGTIALNTRTYVNTLTLYTCLISLCLSKSTAIMLGRLLGRKDFATGERLIAQNSKIAIIANACLAIILLFISRPLLMIFTDNQTIIKTGQLLILIDIVIEVFRAFNHIYADAALVCAKDVRYICCVNIISCLVNNLLLGWLLGIQLNLGLPGMYLAFMLDEVTKSVLQYIRWRSGKWEQNF